MVRGKFDETHPARRRDLDDGTTYRLWHVSGDFKNDFDLHRYPADTQWLDIQFFNARAASNRLVYVVDRATAEARGRSAARGGVSQPQPMGAAERHPEARQPRHRIGDR